MDVNQVQERLVAAGHPLNVDGDLGPGTYAAILDYATQRTLGSLGIQLGQGFAAELPEYGITFSLRLAHFIAQGAHETMAFRYLTELGGATYFSKYDGRADLGNTQPGDGARFRGRGIFQITGRANYDRYGGQAGLDLLSHPEVAAQPDVAVKLACQYWGNHGLNQWADADDVKTITHKINGGYNGLAERTSYVERLKGLLL